MIDLDSDPGPLPMSWRAMGGPDPDLHDPYIELVEWVFKGFRGINGMRPDQRIAWMQRNLPRTYALLAMGRRWPELADL